MAKKTRFVMLTGFLTLAASAGGCGVVEPRGACWTYQDGRKGCYETTEFECESTGVGEFEEGGSCLAWDLLHPPT